MKNAGKSSRGQSFRIKCDFDSLADSSSDEKWMRDKKKLKVREVNFGSRSKSKTFSEKICKSNSESRKNSETDGSERSSSIKNYSNEKTRKENYILAKLTRNISRIYASKLGALLAKQKIEMDDFKRSFVVSLKNELEEWERYIAFVRYQEEKLHKILVKLKNNLNTSEMQNRKVQIIKEKHEEFIQKYEVMMKEHCSEIMRMKNSINKEFLEMGKSYLGDKYGK